MSLISQQVNTIAILLSGGRSSRMGQDKALLTANGQSLRQKNLHLLQQLDIDRVFDSDNQRNKDIIADKGPLTGIYTGLQHMPANWQLLLVLPVDMPSLTIADLDRLMRHSVEAQKTTYFNQSCLPMCLYYQPDLIDWLLHQLTQTQDYSLKNLLNYLQAQSLVDSQVNLQNVNNPRQWQTYLQEYNGGNDGKSDR